MNTRFSVVLIILLGALLISACAPATAAQPAVRPPAPTIQQSLPPTLPPTATPEPAKAPTPVTATSQAVDRAATQQAFMRKIDQEVTVATAVASKGVDHFSGTWAGAMSFSDDPSHKEDVQVVIPQGCQIGQACGYLDNTTVHCKWEMTLTSIQGETLEYTFSKAISGDCPVGSSGKLTMQANGTLLREHKTPDFTASGQLTRQK